MKKKLYCLALAGALSAILFACGTKETQPVENEMSTEAVETMEETVSEDVKEPEVSETEEVTEQPEATEECPLEDGVYKAKFTTDSGMFHVNEANEDWGELTVKDGKMTIHVSLAGKGILNLYPGLADDAQKDGAVLLEPTTDAVTYSDGTTDEVYGFDIPVPYLDKEFDVALIGKKEVWYDHKVKVTEAQPAN